MRPSKKRIIAWTVLAACVLTGIFGLGGAHLHRCRADVMEVFYGTAAFEQAEEDCMNTLLDRAAKCAGIMAQEVYRYLGDDHAVAGEILTCLKCMGNNAAADDRCGAYIRFQHDVEELYNAMYAAHLLDGERSAFKRAYDDFWNCVKHIRRNPYREMALEYNRSIEGFPACIVAAAFGAGNLNDFSR